MHYKMTTPCDACPFLKGSGFALQSLVRHASGEFACHKACDLEDDTYVEKANGKSPHCAGALIFNEKRNTPHQMMRICERLGMYDMAKLDMKAPVGTKASDFPPRDEKRGCVMPIESSLCAVCGQAKGMNHGKA